MTTGISCYCKACRQQVAAGKPAFEGVSLSQEMHVTKSDVHMRPRRPPMQSEPRPPAQFSDEQLDIVADVLAMMRDDWQAHCAALESRLARLEAQTAPAEMLERLGELEQQLKAFDHRGVWKSGMSYVRGNFV